VSCRDAQKSTARLAAAAATILPEPEGFPEIAEPRAEVLTGCCPSRTPPSPVRDSRPQCVAAGDVTPGAECLFKDQRGASFSRVT
jgi:hypothetical protein